MDVVWAAAGDVDEPKSATVAMVRDGTLDLALVWARAFDTQGITEFEALQAPFLITDAAFLKKVVTSPIAADMLQGLADAGLVGLELLPGTPRYPVGLDHPFLALEDFAGARIKVPKSKVSDEYLLALGAIRSISGTPPTTRRSTLASWMAGSTRCVPTSCALARS